MEREVEIRDIMAHMTNNSNTNTKKEYKPPNKPKNQAKNSNPQPRTPQYSVPTHNRYAPLGNSTPEYNGYYDYGRNYYPLGPPEVDIGATLGTDHHPITIITTMGQEDGDGKKPYRIPPPPPQNYQRDHIEREGTEEQGERKRNQDN